MEMTGRMESVENLSEQRRGFASQRQVSHPSHRPLEIADAIPTFPQPDDDTFLHTYKQQNQGDISIALPPGTFLSPLDTVGGHAVGYYGHVRGTVDMDVWVDRTGENPDRVLAALAGFGFSGAQAKADMFREPGLVIRMGVPPVRIELLTSLSGVDFAECYDAREMVEWNGVIVNVISLGMLKLNKRASGRRKDLDDLDHLDQ